MDCSQCGTTLPEAAKFCPQCAAAVGAAPGRPDPTVQQDVGVAKDSGAVVGSIQAGADPLHAGRQQHYGDRITAAHGSAVSTGSGVAVAGNRNVVVTGKGGDDVMVDSQKQVSGGSPEDFRASLADLREQLAALQAQGMSADDSADVKAKLDQIEELTQRPDPPAERIARALENVKEILDTAGLKTSSRPHFFVVLAGGVGNRLWPLSRAKRPKALLTLEGTQPLVSQTVARLPKDSQGNVFVACSRTHAQAICDLLPELPRENVIGEPVPKGTATAICLVAAIAAARRPDALLTALPADAHIEGQKAFLSALVKAKAQASLERIATIGVKARRFDPGLGYIERGDQVDENVYAACGYMVTPNPSSDPRLIQNYLVDTAIHTFPVDLVLRELGMLDGQLLEKIQLLSQVHGSSEFENQMDAIFPELSIETNKVLRTLGDRVVVEGTFAWSDVGSFASLPFQPDAAGNIVRGSGETMDCERCVVMATGARPVVVLGCTDTVVIDCADVLLVTHRDRAQDVRKLVERIRDLPQFQHLV